jgi:CHAT domain-containing protein
VIRWGCLVILVLCFHAPVRSQDWHDADQALAEESGFKARFYLAKLPTSNRTREQELAFTNRVLESFLIERSVPLDTVSGLLTQAQELSTKCSNRQEKNYTLYLAAWALQAQNKPDEAYAQFQSLLPRALHPYNAGVYYRLADLERNVLRKPALARENLLKSVALYRVDSTLYFRKLYRSTLLLGLVNRELGKVPEAETCYTACLSILDNVPEPLYDERAKVLNNMANLFRSDYKRAKYLYEESLTLRVQHVKDSTALTTAYTNLGVFYFNFSNFGQARIHYQQGLQYARPGTTAYNSLIYNYSLLLMEEFDFQSAINVLKRGLDAAVGRIKSTDATLIRIRLQLAQHYSIANEVALAEVQLREIRTLLAVYSPDDPLWVQYFDAAALFHFNQKKYEPMSVYADSAYQLFLTLPLQDLTLKQSLLKRRADAALSLKQWDTATSLFQELKASYEQTQAAYAPPILLATLSLGEIAFNTSQYDSALTTFRHVLEIIQHHTIDSTLFDTEQLVTSVFLSLTYYEKYKTNHKLSDLEFANVHIRQALSLANQKKQALAQDADRLTFSQIAYDMYPVALDVAYALYLEKHSTAAAENFFEVTELNKSQVLLKTLKELKTHEFSGVSRSITDFEQQLAQQETELRSNMNTLLTRKDPEPEIISSLQTAYQQLRTRKESFIDSLKDVLPDYYTLKYNSAGLSLQALQQWLARIPETGVLLYGFGQENVYGMLVTSQAVLIQSCSTVALARGRTKLFRNQMRIHSDQAVLETGKLLYEQLIAGFQSQLTSQDIKTLAIIPEDDLVNLPFEALLMKDPKNSNQSAYLIETYRVLYSYSANLLWQKMTDKVTDQKDKKFIGFAPSFVAVQSTTGEAVREESAQYADFGFTDLPGARVEVEAISQSFGKNNQHIETYIGNQATEKLFKERARTGFDYIHLATHGFILDQQKVSGVAFHPSEQEQDDGLLLTREVYNLHLPARLVVLSACETGLGQYVKGEGVIGLTRAFLYAGAHAMIVSLWKVEDKSTAELMTNFYTRGILAKRPPDVALRNAKLVMIKKGTHPYYWSPFILIGANQ